MALTYDQLSAITEKKFVPKVVDNIFDSGPILKRAKEKFYESVDGGTKIVVPLNYAQVTASDWFDGADTLDTTDNQVITAAEYSWKHIYANITISRTDELKNSGDAAKVDMVKTKIQIAEKTLKDKLGTGLWSDGTTAKSIAGLRVLFSTSNSPGGISQSDYTWWQPQLDSTTTTLTISAMNSVWTDCLIDSDMPTVGLATRNIYNAYYALLQPQQRFADEKTAKGGFSSLMFNGKPIIADSKAPSALPLVFLNENYLHLKYHPDENFRFRKFQEPTNQAVKTAKIFWAGAFCFSNNRMHGGFTALTA